MAAWCWCCSVSVCGAPLAASLPQREVFSGVGVTSGGVMKQLLSSLLSSVELGPHTYQVVDAVLKAHRVKGCAALLAVGCLIAA